MRLQGAGRLRRKLSDLKGTERAHVTKAVRRNTEAGVRTAKVLAPNTTGRTRSEIKARYREGGLVGIVEAIDPGAPRKEKDRAYSIEHGRKRGLHGTTAGYHHMHRTRQFLGKRWKSSLKRAMNKAIKEAARG